MILFIIKLGMYTLIIKGKIWELKVSFEKIKKTVFTISFFSFLVSIAYIAYIEFLKDNRAELTFDITSNINVFDIATKLDNDLKILYKDINLLEDNSTLSIINITIKNEGSSSILVKDYDKEFPLEINFSGGSILKIDLIKASNKYISKKISKMIFSSNSITLPDIIFEPSDYISLSILVLEKEKNDIEINPTGKIANSKPFKIEKSYMNKEYSFWDDLTEGTLTIKFFRFFFYFISFLFYFMLIGFLLIIPFIIFDSIKKMIINYYKNFKIEKYKKYLEYQFTTSDEIILDLYKKNDDIGKLVKDIYSDKSSELIEDYKNYKKELEEKELEEKEKMKKKEEEKDNNENDIKKHYNYNKVKNLINKNILNDNLEINYEIKESFTKFNNYLYK